MTIGHRLSVISDNQWTALAIASTTLALLVHGALNWTGALPGNDDMMRLAQVRDLLAGQAWFEVDQSRFISPEGGAMHWSRLPDLPIAVLVWLLSRFMTPEAAEYVALLVWPRLLLLGALTGLALALRRLGAGLVGTLFGMVCFLVSHAMVQFQPGRIDHHGLELVLVLWGLAALISPQASRRSGALLGFAIAAMVTVAIESLPYAAVLAAAAALLWWRQPAERRGQLLAAGASVLVFGAVAYALDAPGLQGRAVCDAYGSFHFAALATGGLGLMGLAAFTASSGRPYRRLAGVVGVGLAAFAVAVIANPACLGSPYGTLDSAVMTDWMASVTEARDLPRLLATNPAFGVYVFGFASVALLASAAITLTSPPDLRARRGVLLVLLAVAVLVTGWQVRAVVFSHGLAAIAAGLVAAWLYGQIRARDGAVRILAAAGLLALAPTTWQTIGSAIAPAREAPPSAWAKPCFAPEAFAPLAALPQGGVFAPIDLGTAILVRTPHAIYAAPYHRNQGAILRAMAVFEATPDEARLQFAEIGADYLHACPQMGELRVYAQRAPGGLAAQLNAGEAPDWLEPVAVSEDVVTYRIVPNSPGAPS